MNQRRFRGPSSAQQNEYLGVTGYPWRDGADEGAFSTDRPFNKPWDLSPWGVRYQFDAVTGCLYCELSHRMTNNRCYGWDYAGAPLGDAQIAKVYPSDHAPQFSGP